MKCVKIKVSGRVQGVYFRRTTKSIADSLGLIGYVKNLADGSVEVIAQGDEDKLHELVQFCKKGPAGANVTKMDISYLSTSNEFNGFEIKYSHPQK